MMNQLRTWTAFMYSLFEEGIVSSAMPESRDIRF